MPEGTIIERILLVSDSTVTTNELVALLPAASDAVHVTVVLPIENTEPDSGLHVGPLVTPTLSAAVTV